jgi:hypothetical protein
MSNDEQDFSVTLNTAIKCHESGDIVGAKSVYRNLLKSNPKHPKN